MKSKLPHIGTTIFTTMSQLAMEHNALNLAQGFPDFSCSPKLVDLANYYMREGFNQYAPMPGILKLREKISEKTLEQYNAYFDPATEITVTCGATEACFTTISALIEKGDEVIILEPAFDVYAPAIELFGGKPVYIELDFPEFKINWKKVAAAISKTTKLIIINSPHNPTGAIINESDWDELYSIVKDTNIFILSDEVYEHIIFDKNKHASIHNKPELRDRSLVVSSFGKTYHTTGWRLGYCLAPKAISAEFRKIHQYNTFSAVTPMQYAVADFLDDKEQYLGLSEFYQRKRDLFLDLIKPSRFEVIPSHGTYFQLLRYKAISEEKDTDFAIRLTKEFGIAAIPVSVFYNSGVDNKVVRFCFAKQDTTLERAAEILCKI